MAAKDLHPELEQSFHTVAEHYSSTLGPVSDRFVNKAVMLARELEEHPDENHIMARVRQLVMTSYDGISQNMRDNIANEMITVIVRRRERRLRR